MSLNTKPLPCSPTPAGQTALLAMLVSSSETLADDLRRLEPDEWHWLNATARAYRLCSLLASRARANVAWPVPNGIREEWETAFSRRARLAASNLAVLRFVKQRFDKAGIPFVLLKGAALAWDVYDHPACRPMRDIDLMVPPDKAMRAYNLLIDSGFRHPSFQSDQIDVNSHELPLLINPAGEVRIEIHHTIGPVEWPGAAELASKMRATSRMLHLDRTTTVMIPDPQVALLHAIAHAARGHLFENGPQVLCDVVALLDRHQLDWRSFWRDACDLGIERPARLVFGCISAHGGPVVPGMEHEDDPAGHADRIAHLVDLLVQERGQVDERLKARLYGRSGTELMQSALSRAFRPPAGTLALMAKTSASDPRRWLAYPKWLWGGASTVLAAKRKSGVADLARRDQEFQDWCNNSSPLSAPMEQI